MKNKFSMLVGCFTLMLFALCFLVPAQAEDNSPPQTFEQFDDQPCFIATAELQLPAPVFLLSLPSNTEVQCDEGLNLETFSDDWPPGDITAQAIKNERLQLPGTQASLHQTGQSMRQSTAIYNNRNYGVDLDRLCFYNLNYTFVPCPVASIQTTRHVMRC